MWECLCQQKTKTKQNGNAKGSTQLLGL